MRHPSCRARAQAPDPGGPAAIRLCQSAGGIRFVLRPADGNAGRRGALRGGNHAIAVRRRSLDGARGKGRALHRRDQPWRHRLDRLRCAFGNVDRGCLRLAVDLRLHGDWRPAGRHRDRATAAEVGASAGFGPEGAAGSADVAAFAARLSGEFPEHGGKHDASDLSRTGAAGTGRYRPAAKGAGLRPVRLCRDGGGLARRARD